MSEWLDDGSATITGSGNVVSCTASAAGDAVFHALWKGDGSVTSGVHYWEVEDKGGLGAVGMTTLERFGKGYACRSFNFNSINLSDGGALLVGQYGSRDFVAGDKVGLLCEMTDSALTITFYLNGICLGPAFRIASPYPKELYPVLTFKNGGSSAAIQKVTAIPQARERASSVEPFPEGHWKSEGTPHNVSMEVFKGGENAFRVSMQVLNHINFQLAHTAGGWKASPARSTMMAGPPELMQFEQRFVKDVEALTNVQSRDGKLVITTPSGELAFVATVPELPIPVTENPLAR